MGACGPHFSTRAGRRPQPHHGRLDLVADRDRADARSTSPFRAGVVHCRMFVFTTPASRSQLNTGISRDPCGQNPGRPGAILTPRPAPPRTGRGGLPRPARSPGARGRYESGRPGSQARRGALRNHMPELAETAQRPRGAFSRALRKARICATRGERQGWSHASRRTLARGADRGRARRRGSSWRLGAASSETGSERWPCGTGFQVVRYTWDQVTNESRGGRRGSSSTAHSLILGAVRLQVVGCTSRTFYCGSTSTEIETCRRARSRTADETASRTASTARWRRSDLIRSRRR